MIEDYVRIKMKEEQLMDIKDISRLNNLYESFKRI